MAVRQPIVLVCEMSPPLAFGTAQERSLLATEPGVTPIAVFVGHGPNR